MCIRDRSRDQELPTPGLKFTFIERIEDITDIVNAKIAAKEITEMCIRDRLLRVHFLKSIKE